MAYSLYVGSFLPWRLRFVARRRSPKLVRSDNGMNSAGAQNEVAWMVEGLACGAVDSVILKD